MFISKYQLLVLWLLLPVGVFSEANETNSSEFPNLIPLRNIFGDSNILQSNFEHFKSKFANRDVAIKVGQLKEFLLGNSTSLNGVDHFKRLATGFNEIKERAFSDQQDSVTTNENVVDTASSNASEGDRVISGAKENEESKSQEDANSEGEQERNETTSIGNSEPVKINEVTVTLSLTETITQVLESYKTSTETVFNPTTVTEKVVEQNEVPKSTRVDSQWMPSVGLSGKEILNQKAPPHKLFVAPQFHQHSQDVIEGSIDYSKPKVAPLFLVNGDQLVPNEMVHTQHYGENGELVSYEDDEYVCDYIYDPIDLQTNNEGTNNEVANGDEGYKDGAREGLTSIGVEEPETRLTSFETTEIENNHTTSFHFSYFTSTFSEDFATTSQELPTVSKAIVFNTTTSVASPGSKKFNQFGSYDVSSSTGVKNSDPRKKKHGNGKHKRPDFNLFRPFPNGAAHIRLRLVSVFAAIILIAFTFLLV